MSNKIDKLDIQTSSQLCKRLFKEHIRGYVPRLLIAMIFMMVVAACTAAMAYMMQPILDDVFIARDKDKLVWVSGFVLFIFVTKGFASYIQAVIMDYVGQRIVADIQIRLFGHLVNADLGFFHQTSTGKLISHFNHDVFKLRLAVSRVFTGIGKDVFTLAFLLGSMFYEDWLLALVSFIVFPSAFWPIIRLGKKMRKYSGNTQEEIGKMTTLLSQVFQGIRHVKAYLQESYEVQKTTELVERVFHLSHKAERVRAVSRPLMETLGGIAIVTVISYGGYQVIEGTRTTGSFFSFITALLLAYEPLKKLANLNLNLQEGLAAAVRVFAYIDQEPEIQDRPKAKKISCDKGALKFENVSFSYKEEPILNNITLDIPAGKTVALVGASGAGKSTILNLIPRFYDVNDGKILLNETDIRDIKLASLRGHIGLVSQEISLFDDTIAANILYGNRTASQKELIAAAKAAAAHDFIMELPEGYDTMIGENGVNLSGGQRQRISIARAIVKNAPVLLLDEATSSLDTESERQVQKALETLMKGRTTLVIAHRLSTIIGADIIYVINKGAVAESGTHETLMAQNGIYTNLQKIQSTS
ncbi:MAG: ABC transporter ATP-binding protein [Alphaproteobacteria bacterium]